MRPRTGTEIHRQTQRQTDTQMLVTTIHFASSTTHAKCNQWSGVPGVKSREAPMGQSLLNFGMLGDIADAKFYVTCVSGFEILTPHFFHSPQA